MTKTNIVPKISYVDTKAPKPQEIPSKGKAEKAGDIYESADKDAYKALLDGNPKAECIDGGVLSEMFDAASQVPQRRPGYYEGMQNLLGSMMIGSASWKPAQDTVGDIPYVPDLQKDIVSVNPNTVTTMEPVVQRYAGLEKVLTKMIDIATDSMHPNNMSKMTAEEFRSLDAYKRKLIETLAECRIQKARAERYLEKQRAKESAGIW
ncbi:MAG: hypothetical protein JXA24_00845 [Proteobacteria bacterium]|nr:hypothetical protein [Pseudomonadota bacterium]